MENQLYSVTSVEHAEVLIVIVGKVLKCAFLASRK